MSATKKFRIAMQKKGRLSIDTTDLFKSCGLKINSRDDDIPGLVMDHVVDWGIVGQDVLEEIGMERQQDGLPTDYTLVRKLDFGGCRLSLAIPVEQEWKGVESLEGLKIATTYPNLTKRYLDSMGVNFKVVHLTGSVEVAPRAGLADAICDLVSSGATLDANGLKEVQVVYRSQAVLIQRNQELFPEKKLIADTLVNRIDGMMQAHGSKYIMLHAPKDKVEEITALLPGAESPTLLTLEGNPDHVAMHVVSTETLFWETMEKLKALGASSILVLPIEKMLK